MDDRQPALGKERIQKSDAEVHLGVDRNHAGVVDIKERVQMGRRTMYAMMGAGAYGCSGVLPQVISHLWRVFALPRMLYGLEVYSLSLEDVMQLEQLQRSFMKRIQSLPVNAATAAAYGLLGIKSVQQELDLRKLTLMGSVLYHKNTLEHEIAQRQLAVKSIDSKSWFAECNRLLYKYDLPNKHTDSLEHWKTQVKTQIDSYIEVHCYRDSKSSLRYLNVSSLKVGQTYPVWKSLTHDVRTVKRAYPKIRLLTVIISYKKIGQSSINMMLVIAIFCVVRELKLVCTLLLSAQG